jgi:hydroxymethylglutaryl-CoA synthase
MARTADQGIAAYASYLPRHRLRRADLAAALGQPSGTGARVVAGFDEDSTTMAVEAARAASGSRRPGSVWFATTSPAYREKTNATAVHAALDLGADGLAIDVAGSPRSGSGAMTAARALPGALAVLADVRTGLAGTPDERDGGDGAVAFLFGPAEESLAVLLGSASTSGEFLDRWQLPEEVTAHQWEERFALELYLPLVREAVERALAEAGVEQADRVVVSSPHARTGSVVAKAFPGRVPTEPLDLGYTGSSDAGLRLADALDRAVAGDTVLVINAVDGCDAAVWRVTERIGDGRQARPVAAQVAAGRAVPYATYLTWRGLLRREPPRRPEPGRPAAPPSARTVDWKYAFVGSRCTKCGFVHLPPARVCSSCSAVDHMERAPLSGTRGSVATFTVDRLAYSLSPPVIEVVVDFDGGGRALIELADAGAEEVAVGTRVELTFRRLFTTGGVHNYFWKARPLAGEEASDGQ